MPTIHIPRSNRRFDGNVPIGVNGVVRKIPVGVDYDATQAEVDALVAAGIPIAQSFVPEGSVLISASYGSRLPFGVNGVFADIIPGVPFVPTTAVLAALAEKGIPYRGAGGGNPIVIPTALITSLAATLQPGGSQRFFLATADRAGTWSKSGINAADIVLDSATGIHSVAAGAVGDGLSQIIKIFTLTFTPNDGSGSVTQIRTLTLQAIGTPASLSTFYDADFSGASATPISGVPGFSIIGTGAGNLPQLDGAGHLVGRGGTGGNDPLWAAVYTTTSPTDVSNDRALFTVQKATPDADYRPISIFFAAADPANGFGYAFYPRPDSIEPADGRAVWTRQNGVLTTAPFPGSVGYKTDGTADITFVVSADGGTGTLSVIGSSTVSTTIDLTGKTKGGRYGISGREANFPAMENAARLNAFSLVKPLTFLSVTAAPTFSLTQAATYTLAWSGTKPTRLQHRVYDTAGNAVTAWMTGTAPSPEPQAGLLAMSRPYRARATTPSGSAPSTIRPS